MTEHTPGPWEIRHGNIYGPRGDQIILEGADGQLVKSAPDLLTALEKLLPEFIGLYEQFDPDGEIAAWGEWTTLAQTAIAKARGQ